MTKVEIETQKGYRYKPTFEVSFINKLVAVKTHTPVKPVGKPFINNQAVILAKMKFRRKAKV